MTKQSSSDRRHDVEKMLLRRGLRVLEANSRDGLILPGRVERDAERRFYELAEKGSRWSVSADRVSHENDNGN